MIVAALIAHGLIAVALLGAITHQALAVLRPEPLSARGTAFISRYVAVDPRVFRNAVIAMYVASFVLGCLLYPAYRLDARIPLEELQLGWAVGLFELKEHFGGIGLSALPLYHYYWSTARAPGSGRIAITLVLSFIIWFDFISGHIVNNIRGV
ncbi:hypothetical protein E4T66_14215 [Sinimarinibacterium sp. CAU 1509]|uniref:hypothetical protein n=1 Tax=Sinimarinibacterium sp. CAU 1509 TaxID=2562283 RepID=UPI0010AD0A7D|nr:hypothetical protein [Sinimarinibacterium sp. CAU 1509]TJY59528.1 hypothetical protein E4T66_14215 [Sinimarinibacterium sp. CAU 1509]